MSLHIVGAGLAGLSAALIAAEKGLTVKLHEAAGHAGGRARSWVEPGLERMIDNGTHMVVGANHAVFDFLRRAGNPDGLVAGPESLPLRDLDTGEIWSAGGLSTVLSVLGALPTLGLCGPDATVEQCLGRSRLYRRFWDPLSVAVMNTASDQASAEVMRRVAMRTVWRSRAASRPYLIHAGLTQTFVRPALERLAALGVSVKFAHPLRSLAREGARVSQLHFDDTAIDLTPGDSVILATPWTVARGLLPEIPDLPASPIVNAHFRLDEPPSLLPDGAFLGVLGGTAQWLFRRNDVVSVTVSAAGPVVDQSAEALADTLWRDVSRALDLKTKPNATRIIKEKRATLFHTPAVERSRPPSKAGDNLFLAGDWTATGLPCTLEGAIVSGRTAAELILSTH